MRLIQLVLVAFLLGMSSPLLGCNAHPPTVNHSEWAWMQQFKDPKTGKVETQSGDFWSKKSSDSAPQEGRSSETERPIRYVK